MEAKELRIWNLVTDQFYDSFNNVITIDSITDKGINVTAVDSDKPYGMHTAILEVEYEFDKLKPIPLTEEWLIKLGFKVRRNNYFRKGDLQINISHNYDVTNAWLLSFDESYSLEIIVGYVHQLQNLYFALTGEELTIKQ